MTRIRAWGLSAALTVGAGAPAVAGDPPTQTTLAAKLFGPPKPKAPGPSARAAAPATPAVAPLPPEVLADALRAEQDAYLRRLTVCSELRRVAAETNNDGLARQADELERQAAAVYNQRVAALGVPKVRSPLPESSTAAAYAPVDPQSAANRLTAPAAPAANAVTADAQRIAPPVPNREVKP